MTDLVVIVPSRGRPDAARELAQAFDETCTAGTKLVFAIDGDDPAYGRYPAGSGMAQWSGTMVSALNATVRPVIEGRIPEPAEPPFAVGFMGDDHRPRTRGWDARYLEALRELGTGIVYGNDLLQGERLPTQCAMTTDIVRALGFMAPPTLRHLAVDNWWLELGHAAGCIRYLPFVVVEHMHPAAGKAAVDEGYARVNAPEMYEHDLGELARLRTAALPEAAASLRRLREARV